MTAAPTATMQDLAALQLVFFPANQAWAFTFGDAITRMGDAPMFFQKRADALFEARALGLRVIWTGAVVPADTIPTSERWNSAKTWER